MGLLIPSVKAALLNAGATRADLYAALAITEHTDGHVHIDLQPAARTTLRSGSIAATRPCGDSDAWQSAFASLVEALRQAGVIPGWRDERFSVRTPEGAVWFALERACFRPLGLISHAVHAHAWCANGDTWLGRRAAHKATDPLMLDNLAAGGLSHGETPADCMVRELWEEAGVPPTLAQGIQALEQPLLSERAESDGIHREWLHCYTLNLPDAFTPVNQDGEVDGFIRLDPTALQACIHSGAMTVDAARCAALALRVRRAL